MKATADHRQVMRDMDGRRPGSLRTTAGQGTQQATKEPPLPQCLPEAPQAEVPE